MFLFDIGRQKLGAGKRFQRPCMTANGVSSIISLFFRLLGFAVLVLSHRRYLG